LTARELVDAGVRVGRQFQLLEDLRDDLAPVFRVVSGGSRNSAA
jgi:hypothetical protein